MKVYAILMALALGACTTSRTAVVTDDQSGTVELRVVPSSAEVYVDQKLVGKAYDFNGSAQVMKLPQGQHTIVVKSGDKACKSVIYLSDTREVIRCNLE